MTAPGRRCCSPQCLICKSFSCIGLLRFVSSGGSAIGPVIGGALAQAWDWRAPLWFLTTYAAVILILLALCLPETYRRPLPSHGNLRDGSTPPSDEINMTRPSRRCFSLTTVFFQDLWRFLQRPLHILTFLRFPLVLMTLYLSSISYGVIVILSVSIQQGFNLVPYQFNSIIIGLLFLPTCVGVILGSLVCGKWSDRIMNREAEKLGRYTEDGNIVHAPEDRMRENVWASLFIVPAALLWFGWSLRYGVFWLVPVSILPPYMFDGALIQKW